MDTDSLNRWISLGATLGVLVGVIFLAIEIRQNTEMTRAQIIQSRAETAMSLAAETFNSEHIPGIVEKANEDGELTYQEAFRYGAWLRATLRNQDNNIQQYNQGFLGEHIPRAVAGVVRVTILSTPRGREFWERSRYGFSDEFQDLVDAVIAESEPAN